MKQQIRYGALAALASVSLGGVAHADSAKTLGGIVVTSDDGNYVASLGGRIQFDYTGIFTDKYGNGGFDSGDEENDSGFYFRRVYLTLTGRIYGWRYRIDEDLSNTSNPAAGFKYVFVSHDIGEYGAVRIGQAKPWRSLDELASDLDNTFMERNINSASGLFGGRQYTQGVFFRYSRPAFTSYDHFWGGASVYSLNSAGASTNEGTGTPTAGLGYNARLTYQPILLPGKWLHLGANFSSEHADNGASLTSAASAWYSYKGVTQTIASFAGSPQPASASLANLGGGNNPTVNITQAELAGVYGPVFVQSEFGLARFSQPTASAKGVPNVQNVYDFSGEVTYYVTGESRPFDTDAGSYSKPKPKHEYGAVELALGYNFIKNRDIPAGDTSVCKPSLGSIPTGTTITKCDLSYISAGANYYVNSNVEFMLNYNYGSYDIGKAGEDHPKAINARMQIWF